jgi:4-carboxymuconolactone decarboxylase
LAADIDPATLSRLPLPADLAEDAPQKKGLYYAPGNVNGQPVPTDEPQRLYSPKLAEAMNAAHRYVKYESGMDERLIVIAVLVTARMANSQFEWTRWEMHGRHEGEAKVDPAIVDIIKYCKPVAGLGPKESTIIKFGREMFGPTDKVSSTTYADAVSLFGRQGVIDLVDLMGLYKITALEIKAYDARLDPKRYKPLLPPLSSTPDCQRS